MDKSDQQEESRSDVNLFNTEFQFQSPSRVIKQIYYLEKQQQSQQNQNMGNNQFLCSLENEFDGIQYLKFDIFGKQITPVTKIKLESIEECEDNASNQFQAEIAQIQELQEEDNDQILQRANKENCNPLANHLLTPQRPQRSQIGNQNLGQINSNHRSPLLDITTPPLHHTSKKKKNSGFLENFMHFSTPKQEDGFQNFPNFSNKKGLRQ